MDAADVKILDRKDGLIANTSPDGRNWRVYRFGDTAMYEISQCREDEFGREVPDRRAYVPPEFKAVFTSMGRAQQALTRFLTQRWDESDAVKAKLDKKAGKKDAA